MPPRAPSDPCERGGLERPDAEALACTESTRQRLLDAAERLFAERGYDGTSMRALARRAGTSVSAANYHFGGKHALLREVLSQRLSPINEARIALIDELEAAAAPAPAALEDLIEAFVRPALDAWSEGGPDVDNAYRHIAAQLHVGPHALMAELKLEIFGPLLQRFLDALERTLPEQGRDELRMRTQFMVGSLIHVLGGHLEIHEGGREAFDDEAVLRRIVAFCAAGLQAKVLVPSGDLRARGEG